MKKFLVTACLLCATWVSPGMVKADPTALIVATSVLGTLVGGQLLGITQVPPLLNPSVCFGNVCPAKGPYYQQLVPNWPYPHAGCGCPTCGCPYSVPYTYPVVIAQPNPPVFVGDPYRAGVEEGYSAGFRVGEVQRYQQGIYDGYRVGQRVGRGEVDPYYTESPPPPPRHAPRAEDYYAK
jgi:hypothetical protein